MSRHHRAQKWSTHSPKLREQHAATFPQPCMCGCGQVITKDTPRSAWHVGHRRDAALGGPATFANTGPIIAGHNLRAGGRLGARIVNARRQRSKDIRPW